MLQSWPPQYKLILYRNTDEMKLYNLKKDLSEDIDLSDKKTKLANQMKQRLVEFVLNHTHNK